MKQKLIRNFFKIVVPAMGLALYNASAGLRGGKLDFSFPNYGLEMPQQLPIGAPNEMKGLNVASSSIGDNSKSYLRGF